MSIPEYMVHHDTDAILTSATRRNYDTKAGYFLRVERDGIEIATFTDYVELEWMLKAAGYAVPNRQNGAITVLNVPVILEAHPVKDSFAYRIGAVVKQDFKTKVTRQQVLDAEAERRNNNKAEKAAITLSNEEKKRLYTDPSTLARIEKKAMQDRFAHGEQLIRWQLERKQEVQEQASIWKLHNAAWHRKAIA